MSEYLAPGVYVEETSFRSKSIEGVSTTTTGFIGATRSGPLGSAELVTSLAEFERVYGDGRPLTWQGADEANYTWHAVRAFFDNGGRRLYVARVWSGGAGFAGHGRATGAAGALVSFEARSPGAASDGRVVLRLVRGKNAFSRTSAGATIAGLTEGDTWRVEGQGYFVSVRRADPATGTPVWVLTRIGGDDVLPVADLPPDAEVSSVRIALSVYGDDGQLRFARDGINPAKLAEVFAEEPATQSDALTQPVLVRSVDLGALCAALDGDAVTVAMRGGLDGVRPPADAYEGRADEGSLLKTGLKLFEDQEDISIVAAPGALVGQAGDELRAMTISGHLIRHCQSMRYRIAVLDPFRGMSIRSVREWRARMDSSHAALYYPWIRVLDPVSRREVLLPPSGFIAGIYARNDNLRAVYKAPANEVINLALGFEQNINHAQQEVLNPEGINCLRFFEGRGLRVWGARTISSDPEWKYVNLRRYFAYLERSIDRGTQWAVFEPNGQALWSNIKRTIEDFLLNEYQSGALLGDRPERAYFVRCDRSTMTQNDLDNGRLVCLIGVAPLKPAEFVIFRIGQWTADARN